MKTFGEGKFIDCFAAFHNSGNAWLVLILSTILTVSAWYLAQDYAKKRAEERFGFAVQDAHERILRRMSDYEQILRGCVAFFNGSDCVTREDWRTFVEDLQIDQHFPGLQGMGYAVVFGSGETLEIENRVKSEGFPEFRVHPAGNRELMTSIVYLEPFDQRNQRAFGYDMFSEKTRRRAMEYAYRTGLPGLSGKVILLQETEEDRQPGFLMYLPVYESSSAPFDSWEDRRNRLKGFVYSPFRMKDLMKGILGSGSPDVTFTIFDENLLDADGFLFNSEELNLSVKRSNPRYRTSLELPLGSHYWTVQYSSSKPFEEVVATAQPALIGMGGLMVDILLFVVIFSLARNRKLIARQAKEIATSHQLYQGIIEGTPDGFWILDSAGKIIEVNPAYCVMSGYSAGEVIGKTIDFFEGQLSIEEIEARKNEIKAAQWKCFRSEHRRKDGSVWPVEVLATYWPNQEGRFFVFLKDITASLATENSLIEAKQKAEAANKAKSDFLANMSHEIRTPMNAVMGLTQLALDGDLTDEAREYLGKSLHGSKALLALLNEILDYSKIEANRMDLSLNWVRLDHVFYDVCSLFQIQAERSGHDFSLEIEKGVPNRIFADSLRLGQVMNNLLGNAIKFSKEGAIRVLIRPGNVEDGKMELHFSVTDQGIGMSDEQMQHLFEPFTQADTSTTRNYGGTGLGLSICDRLVRMMGGNICVESSLGEGSSFHFTIVAAFDRDSIIEDDNLHVTEMKNPVDRASDEDLSLEGLNILVGEDNSTNQLIVMRLLENAGAKVDVASNGCDVLVALDRNKYDLLLLDLQMPQMGGIECANKVRSSKMAMAGIPIIAMTAAVGDEDRQRCLQAGMNGFVGKPFDKSELLSQIVKLARPVAF